MKIKNEKISIEGENDSKPIRIDGELFKVLDKAREVLYFDEFGDGKGNDKIIGNLNDDIAVTVKCEADGKQYEDSESLLNLDEIEENQVIGLKTGKERLEEFLEDVKSLVEEEVETTMEGFRCMDIEIYERYLAIYKDFDKLLKQFRKKHDLRDW